MKEYEKWEERWNIVLKSLHLYVECVYLLFSKDSDISLSISCSDWM